MPVQQRQSRPVDPADMKARQATQDELRQLCHHLKHFNAGHA